MTIDQIDALNALQRRLGHTCAIARLVSAAADDGGPDVAVALRGISESLDGISDRLEEIVPLRATA